jgi:Zn ribbon nucleic-acid-binding protein
MFCPSCDSAEFGVCFDPAFGVVRACMACGYAEEASQSEVGEWYEENPDSVAHVA